tara:strand:+ start:84 stop:218 length:135 start_codon:yes stop_codon:yes gene_type:complete
MIAGVPRVFGVGVLNYKVIEEGRYYPSFFSSLLKLFIFIINQKK